MNTTLPVRLSKQGLFFILGKICYAMELLQSKFDGEEDVPAGAETAIEELEVAREPLMQLLLSPIDLREEFQAYIRSEYEIELNLDFAVLPEDDDPNFTATPVMSLVRT